MTPTTGAGRDLPEETRELLEAVVAISSELDLHSVLDRIVVSACRLTGARYGALGVLGGLGDLVDFVTSGLTPDQHAAIGVLPRGHGILGLIIDQPAPLRLEHLSAHPDSFGFPAHHPPMDSFLGVPVRIRGTVFGNLYLTEKEGGDPFTENDERVVEALARAVGLVIDNARSFAQSERRRQWLEASARIVEALQPPVDVEDALSQIVVGVRHVLPSAVVAVLHSNDDGYAVVSAEAPAGADLDALVAAVQEDVRRAEQDVEPVVVPRRGDASVVVLVPLRAHLVASGVLMVVPVGPLEVEETELLASFADQASLALDRAQALSDRSELMLVADRERIARDLHDLVIQRLFATGLQLQGARRFDASAEVRDRLESAVGELDVTIRDIRSTVFELQRSHDESLRADVRGVVKEYVPVLGFTPLVRTTGPVDASTSPAVATQLLAVLREALSNVARHSEADAAMVEVEASTDRIALVVTDNGSGLPSDRRDSGLRNVGRRARELGGTVRLLDEEPHGTRLEWVVPLEG